MTEIIVAVIAVIGSGIGSFMGVVTSAKLTNYRLSQLEKKVDKHNNFAERIPLIEERIDYINRRLDEG